VVQIKLGKIRKGENTFFLKEDRNMDRLEVSKIDKIHPIDSSKQDVKQYISFRKYLETRCIYGNISKEGNV
jgi:hypothetical protein